LIGSREQLRCLGAVRVFSLGRLWGKSAVVATYGLSPDEEQATGLRMHAMRIKTHVKAGWAGIAETGHGEQGAVRGAFKLTSRRLEE
jgi:hypothetical protein